MLKMCHTKNCCEQFYKRGILILLLAEGQTKKMCVSGYMLFKIRVGRSDYFLFFELILFA